MTDKTPKEIVEGLQTDFNEFKEANDARLDAVEKREGTAEIDAKVDRINTSLTNLEKANQQVAAETKARDERIEQLEAELDQAGPANGKAGKAAADYMEKFGDWMRSARVGEQPSPVVTQALKEAEAALPEHKQISGATAAAGGALIPAQIANIIHDQVRVFSPLRQLCRQVNIGVRTYDEVVNIHGEASAWVGEASSRSEQNTPTFRSRRPTMGTLYTYPFATEEAMDDSNYDVGRFLVDSSVQEFAIAEGTAFLSGNGTSRPTGMLNTAPLADDDDASPPRSAEAYEFIHLDLSSPTSAVDPDQIIQLTYQLRAGYRQGSSFAMNSTVGATIRKLKQNSEYIWSPSFIAGQPSTLVGFPVTFIEAMDNLTAPTGSPLVYTHPIMFGNFQAGYLIVDRVGLRITVDNNITAPGFIKWYIRKRVGGIILDNNAVKVGRYSAT